MNIWNEVSRRDFLKLSSVAAAGTLVTITMRSRPAYADSLTTVISDKNLSKFIRGVELRTLGLKNGFVEAEWTLNQGKMIFCVKPVDLGLRITDKVQPPAQEEDCESCDDEWNISGSRRAGTKR